MRAKLTVFSLPFILLAGCATFEGPPAPVSILDTATCVPATPIDTASSGNAGEAGDHMSGPGGALEPDLAFENEDSHAGTSAGHIADAELAASISCSLSEMADRDGLYQVFAGEVAADRRHIGAGMLAAAFTGVAFEVFDAHPDNSAAAALGLGGLTVLNSGLNQNEILAVVADSREAFECYLVPAIQVRRALNAGTRTALAENRRLLIDAIALAQKRTDDSSGDETSALRAELRAAIDAAEALSARSRTAHSALTHFADDYMLSWRAADSTTQRRLLNLQPNFADMLTALQALQTSQGETTPEVGDPGTSTDAPEGFTNDDLELALVGLRGAMRNVSALLEFDYAAQRSQLATCQAKAAG